MAKTLHTAPPPPSPEATDGLSLRRFLRRLPSQSRSRMAVESIITAFDELLQKRGDESVPLEVVAQRAGVGIGSLYEYFANKDALLGGLIEKATRKNFTELLSHVDATPGPLEARTRALAEAVVETYLRHPARTNALMGGIIRLGLIRVVVAERDRFARELAARALPLLPGAALDDLEVSMCLLCDAIMGVIHAELTRATPTDRALVADQLCSLTVATLRARHPAPAATS